MKVLLTSLLIVHFIPVHSQQTVSGSVTDEIGRPIPFASIQSSRIKSTGTISDKNGNFKIDGISNRDTLICSHINYQAGSEVIFGNNKIIFRLKKSQAPSTLLVIETSARSTVINPNKKVLVKDSLSPKKEDELRIFEKVEVPARFGDEPNSLRSYLEKNIIYPDSSYIPFDATGEFEGTITVHFTIDKTGKATNAFVIKGLSNIVDQAVIKTIESMPLWKPAIQNGRTLDSEQEITVYFKVKQKT